MSNPSNSPKPSGQTYQDELDELEEAAGTVLAVPTAEDAAKFESPDTEDSGDRNPPSAER